MKNRFYAITTTSAAIITALSLVACSARFDLPKKEHKIISEAEAADLVAKAKQAFSEGRAAEAVELNKAAGEKYARLGELLLTPDGGQYAHDLFKQALEADPSNSKAHFYLAGTGPLMAFKGFLPRGERLVVGPRENAELQKFRDSVAELKMPEVSQFVHQLPEGDAPATTYHDVQRFQRERLLPALIASLDHLKKIDASQPLKLNLVPRRMLPDPSRHSSSYSYSYNYCYNDPTLGWKCDFSAYNHHYEDQKLKNEYFIDQHDLKILQSAYRAMIDSVRLGTAYSIKDGEYAVRRLQALDTIRRRSGKGITSKDVVEVLREFKEFLVLEKDHQLAEVNDSTSESIRDYLELASLDATLCRDTATRNETNSAFRPICFTLEALDGLHIASDALAGPTEIEIGQAAGKKVMILMDITRILKNPIKDLKALLPLNFDAKGDPLNYPDLTIGGLFPNGDLLEKLKEVGASTEGAQVSKALRKAIRGTKDHI